MLEINSDITIKTAEIRFDFVRSSGPGGQNVNKVASAAQLRFDIGNSTSIPDEIKPRRLKLAGKRVNSTAAPKEKRLRSKKIRSNLKRLRGNVKDDD